ncbi:hypothetical protein N824_22180 [Pedobacter sp. V48]|nr:hypothetical protein N824_22180 [Pedobacter sp. V48]
MRVLKIDLEAGKPHVIEALQRHIETRMVRYISFIATPGCDVANSEYMNLIN